ncbi:MAG TPA: GNVR domain-containing protein [Anaerolineae bacterium]|nr:GNVR domain-containing protein [Anaerolineae bacterium]HQH37429.1 GNVR domain-containing protein [Anaerolineae bacterium]
MEEEIDLRIYLDILLKWWWLIVLGAVVVGAGAFLVSSLMPPVYEASAGVVSLKSRAEVSLGSGVQTITEDDISYGNMVGSTAIMERTQQRLNTLAGMVKNGAIAQQVVTELSADLDEEERDPAVLLDYVEGQLLQLEDSTGSNAIQGSDTIQIIVSHKDPVKAALIANAWARAYEIHVNGIYGEAQLSPFVDIASQVQKARIEYNAAQEAWLTFLSEDDQINAIQRQIDEETIIINNLRSARQTAISTVVDKEVKVREALIDAYLSDVQANRLFAFEKGQTAKREILSALVDSEISNRLAVIQRDRNVREQLFETAINAEIAARLQVFEQERDALRVDLEEDYNRKQRIENLLVEAEMMRDQLREGGEASARSNGLALLAFKSRVFNAAEGLPFDRLDLQASSIDALNPNRSAAEQIADLDALIIAMEREVARLEAAIQEKSTARLEGKGYQFLDLLSPEYLTLSFTQTLGMDTLTGATVISPNLSAFILKSYTDTFEIGSMALAAQDVATDTQLFAEIQKLYPELYTKDAWMELANSIPETPELVSLANQMADDLLKMKGLEELLAFSVLDEPLSKEIDQRELRVRELEAEVSRLTQYKKDLQQQRDLTWQAYSVLLSKAQEVTIASASEGSEVRFASPAVAPLEPVSPHKLRNTAVGLAVGLIGGVIGAFLFSYLGLDSHPRAFWAQLTGKKPASA